MSSPQPPNLFFLLVCLILYTEYRVLLWCTLTFLLEWKSESISLLCLLLAPVACSSLRCILHIYVHTGRTTNACAPRIIAAIRKVWKQRAAKHLMTMATNGLRNSRKKRETLSAVIVCLTICSACDLFFCDLFNCKRTLIIEFFIVWHPFCIQIYIYKQKVAYGFHPYGCMREPYTDNNNKCQRRTLAYMWRTQTTYTCIQSTRT